MINKRKNGFTLVELVAVLVIMAVLATIATPLILNLINKAKASANKRGVDAYGKALELSVLSYLMDKGKYPSDLTTLTVEYTGKEVACNIKNLNSDGSIYLSECSVGNKEVKDTTTEDGFYHYGNLVASNQEKTAVATLLSKANDVTVTTYETGTDASHEMYTFEHEATVQTEALTDYRYIGSDPYNYVTFNNELWRIIGVFTVEDEDGNQEQRMKIIRNASIGSYEWDNSRDESIDYGSNRWSTAILNDYLNETYYSSLTSEAQSMIVPTKFYLGGSNSVSHSASSYYIFERGTTVYNGRSKNWTGKIGLMYPSDYAYTYANGVDNKCYTDTYYCRTSYNGNPSSGWLYNNDYHWTISPDSDVSYGLFLAYSDGNIGYIDISGEFDVRPSLYLSSDIQITEGNGSQESPYQLKIN